jgi:hypothetical protein
MLVPASLRVVKVSMSDVVAKASRNVGGKAT